MSLLKKLGAVTVWTASATVWLGAKAVEAGFEAASEKVSKRGGSFTSSNGCTYTVSDYKDSARRAGDFAEKEGGILDSGFKKAKELWNED